jgi:hypothetical protein
VKAWWWPSRFETCYHSNYYKVINWVCLTDSLIIISFCFFHFDSFLQIIAPSGTLITHYPVRACMRGTCTVLERQLHWIWGVERDRATLCTAWCLWPETRCGLVRYPRHVQQACCSFRLYLITWSSTIIFSVTIPETSTCCMTGRPTVAGSCAVWSDNICANLNFM